MQVLDELALKIISSIGPTRLVIGLSGGADSTLVLLISNRVRQLDPRYKVLAVHCIHGLDEDDPIWLNHCTKLCKALDVDLVTPKLNIVYGNGRSPEEVSRKERYRALLENLDSKSVLMLGHQADDQVESFLLALKRGSGPYGLSGMRYKLVDERGTILRPLLELHKAQIIEIIEALGFTHVFDISNTYLKFERNFIRLKVLPLFKERFPGMDKAVLRSQKLCSYEHDLAMRYTKEVFDRIFNQDNLSLDISSLDVYDDALMTSLLRMFIGQKTQLPPELNTVLDAVNICRISPDQSAIIQIGEYQLRRFKHLLFLIKPSLCKATGHYELKVGSPLTIDDYTYSLEQVSDECTGFYTDSVILNFDYKGSQKLKPISRNHSREIKKLFSEYEIPTWQRDSKCLVMFGEKIIAFANLFITEDSKYIHKCQSKYCLKIISK